jgi:restriction endonuclease Mrr
MSLADEILVRARRLIQLESQKDILLVRIRREKAEYQALIDGLQSKPAAQTEMSLSPPLRTRILGFLKGQSNQISLTKIQEAVGEPRDKVIWTLANLKRAGHVLNPKRGYWITNPDGIEGPETSSEPDEPRNDVGF